MPDDALVDAHKEWIGYVQPVGLLVAPAALVHRGIVPDRHIAPLQERLDAATRSATDSDPSVPDFAEFATSFLNWEHRDLAGAPGGPPLPGELAADLIEYGERLVPTYAVPAAGDDADGWQMLIRVDPLGNDFDQVQADDGKHWAASPHARFERLLRETNIPIGLLSNAKSFRLVYAPKGETSGFATFDLESMLEVAGRPMLSAFHMLLKVERLFGAPEQNLPSLLAESRDYQETVSKELADQVLIALNELLRGFHAADLRTHRTATIDLIRTDPDHLYSALLTALLRLVFILYAEDRDLFPRNEVWEQNYSLGGLFERLRDDAALYPDTMDDRYGAWAQLLALWRMVHSGARHDDLQLIARRGQLFDPDRFAFLEGRTTFEDAILVPAISDGVVWRVLRALMVLSGERLSYRTLDVEQLGSVYQSVMGFTVDVTTGPSIAIRPPKRSGASATIDLDALLSEASARRPEWIRERTDRKLTPKMAAAVRDARTTPALEMALLAVIDSRITARPLPLGVPVLQPTEARRRTGSHYTPRALTAPIVAETLRPLLERLGDEATPDDILSLRILDPALGSGAFLVETCRQLAERLQLAWERHGSMPMLAPDEDILLHARRLIAHRCLYGVDRNPMAADLAKLSLWLATLARDHEFAFLDHAIKHGDALVGLTREQIESLNWSATGQLPLITGMIREGLRLAANTRDHIRASADGATENELAALLLTATAFLSELTLLADAVLLVFFSGQTPKERERHRQHLLAAFSFGEQGWPNRLHEFLESQNMDRASLRAFHWQLEFPEVFLRDQPGFDAIVGNPPYMGGTKISTTLGKPYFDWLLKLNSGSKNRCDLVAHFFRKCFDLLRQYGSFGLVATKTIAEGDTREGGLQRIVSMGGQIYAAVTRLRWPGEAAVIVSVIHVAKRHVPKVTLNGRKVDSISCYLVSGSMNDSPHKLSQALYSSLGSKIYGQGFLFDDDDAHATPLSVMHSILAERPQDAERIRPYVGGNDITSQADPKPSRYVIYLSDLQTEAQLASFPALEQIVRDKVKPERDALGNDPNATQLKRKWWAYQAHRPELYRRLADKSRVLCHAEVSKYLAFTFLPTGYIYSQQLVLFDSDRFSDFCILQSQVHETWVRFFATYIGETLRYTPSDIFDTFPFPLLSSSSHTESALHEVASSYFEIRAELMTSTGAGLTGVYNRFHDPSESSQGIQLLRTLHRALDRVALDAYGWEDISADASFELTRSDENGDGPMRYIWPAETRDTVFARLLELNAKRKPAASPRGLPDAYPEKSKYGHRPSDCSGGTELGARK